MNIDTLSLKIEKLQERIRDLKYTFKNSQLETDADDAKEQAIEALDNYLEAVSEDMGAAEEKEPKEDEDLS